MIRNSFTVSYRHHGIRTTILGVTSIVPNLNGFLFFTEDGENYFIEKCDLTTGNCLTGVYFEYSSAEDLADEFAEAEEGSVVLIDHRKDKGNSHID